VWQGDYSPGVFIVLLGILLAASSFLWFNVCNLSSVSLAITMIRGYVKIPLLEVGQPIHGIIHARSDPHDESINSHRHLNGCFLRCDNRLL